MMSHFKDFKVCMFVCVSLCQYVYMNVNSHGDQRHQVPLKLIDDNFIFYIYIYIYG